MDIFETDAKYIANTYRRYRIVVDHGCGSTLWGADGKRYLDLGSGIAVNTFGAGDEEWKAAVVAQMNKIAHISNYYYSEPTAKLAEMLCERTKMSRVFFGNSGAEANECAIKVARKYAHDRWGEERNTIITLCNSFHGRTVTTLSATGQDVFHRDFGPFTPGFVHVPANDSEALAARVAEGGVAAIMLEMIQGEGGVIPLTQEFADTAARLCRESDILLVVDEVQSGNGRTGKLYSYEWFGIKPDIVTTAKGLGGGLPIGVCMLGEKVADTMTAGSHGSTFGGNPLAAAGACSILSRIDDTLLASVREKSEYIRRELLGAKNVAGVTGMGLMLAIETSKPAGEVAAECLERGLLVLTAKTKVRLLPALSVSWDELREAIGILRSVIEA